jgi:hypothetical protein
VRLTGGLGSSIGGLGARVAVFVVASVLIMTVFVLGMLKSGLLLMLTRAWGEGAVMEIDPWDSRRLPWVGDWLGIACFWRA